MIKTAGGVSRTRERLPPPAPPAPLPRQEACAQARSILVKNWVFRYEVSLLQQTNKEELKQGNKTNGVLPPTVGW